MLTAGCRVPFAFRQSSSSPVVPTDATIVSIAHLVPHQAYHVTSTPMSWPCPSGLRTSFKYQQGSPVWRTPLNDPFQFGSGFIIVAQQPGLAITRVKYTPVLLHWYTSTGGRLLAYNHPVPYP